MDDGTYRGIAIEVVLEVGKVAIAGTAVEEVVYRIAEALNIDKPRASSGSSAAEKIRKCVNKHGVPPWAQTSPEDLETWIADAVNALERRNAVIHRMYLSRATDEGWVQHGLRTSHREPSSPISIEEVSAVRAELDGIFARGLATWRGLLAKLARGVYAHYYGPAEGDLVVVHTDGERPKRPTDEQITEWWRELDAQFPGYFAGTSRR